MGTAPCCQLPRAGDRGPGQKGLCTPRDSRPSVPSVPSNPSAFVHRPSPSRPGMSVREALGAAESGLCPSDQRCSHHPQPPGGHQVCSSGTRIPKVNRSHCPTGKRRDCQSWVKTVNAGAEGGTRPPCRAVPTTDGEDTSGAGGEGPHAVRVTPTPFLLGHPLPHPPAPGGATPPFYPPNPTTAPRLLSPSSCLTPLRFIVRPSLGPSAP